MNASLRIGYLVSKYPAASHTFIMREVEELRRRGLTIETFSIRKPSDREVQSPRTRAAFESTYYVLPMRLGEWLRAHFGGLLRPIAYFQVLRLALRHRAPGARALLWSLFHFAEAIVLAQVLRERGIDHLHNHFANSGANVGLLTSRFLGLSWSLTLHGISETDYPAGLLLPEKIRAAEFVVSASWFGRAQAMRISDADHWRKIFVARCGLDLAELPSRTAAARVGGEELRIVCVGRLSAEKGHLGLFEAFAGLREDGVKARLVLVGDGPQRAAMERCCQALGIAGSVTFLGMKQEEETLAEIANSDLLVLPSFMEGLPIVLMEAMALGVPAVASRVAGVPELIEDGCDGLLFTPADWVDLREKMRRALTDAALRERMREAARGKIEKEFEIGRAVEPLVAHLLAKGDIGSARLGAFRTLPDDLSRF